MWQLSRWGPQPIIVFEYDQTRKKEVSDRILGEYAGYIQVDGYAGYNSLFTPEGPRFRVGCMAHCLRKFRDVVEMADKEMRGQHRSQLPLGLIRKLYDIEKRCQGKRGDARRKARNELGAEKILNEL